ncbi:hypothetical protein IV203_026102 [Nitzschia inconspicua]|uniref:Uncharacterized protein n=1 Tax=Nitzschia inconspicua TaxID=303405 RepID=A0A9K3PWU9_9STRA|nr:hypothetical protein IV203_026102 [Nitzschia inconspicua]
MGNAEMGKTLHSHECSSQHESPLSNQAEHNRHNDETPLSPVLIAQTFDSHAISLEESRPIISSPKKNETENYGHHQYFPDRDNVPPSVPNSGKIRSYPMATKGGDIDPDSRFKTSLSLRKTSTTGTRSGQKWR